MSGSEFIPDFESIVGQQRPKRILTTFLRKDRIPHALLFSGIDGVGKRTTAMVFAMACNCDPRISSGRTDMGDDPAIETPGTTTRTYSATPCNSCRSCNKIRSGHHPDVIHLAPSGSIIKIAQIRDLCRTLAMKPYEASYRFVIISDAQAMNPESGNALLKVLEEPPDRTILILSTSRPSDLLPTIVSRCQHIRFSPISQQDLKALLVRTQGVSPTEATVLAAMADGSFTKAMEMFKSDWMHRRNWLLAIFGSDQPESISSKPIGLLMAIAERLSKNREELADALAVLKSWIRDLVISGYRPQTMMNTDHTEVIQTTPQQVGLQQLLAGMSALQIAEREIQTNLNIRLIAESLVMRLAGRMPV